MLCVRWSVTEAAWRQTAISPRGVARPCLGRVRVYRQVHWPQQLATCSRISKHWLRSHLPVHERCCYRLVFAWPPVMSTRLEPASRQAIDGAGVRISLPTATVETVRAKVVAMPGHIRSPAIRCCAAFREETWHPSSCHRRISMITQTTNRKLSFIHELCRRDNLKSVRVSICIYGHVHLCKHESFTVNDR